MAAKPTWRIVLPPPYAADTPQAAPVEFDAEWALPGLEENQHGVFLVVRSTAPQETTGAHDVKAIFPSGSWEYAYLDDTNAA